MTDSIPELGEALANVSISSEPDNKRSRISVKSEPSLRSKISHALSDLASLLKEIPHPETMRVTYAAVQDLPQEDARSLQPIVACLNPALLEGRASSPLPPSSSSANHPLALSAPLADSPPNGIDAFYPNAFDDPAFSAVRVFFTMGQTLISRNICFL